MDQNASNCDEEPWADIGLGETGGGKDGSGQCRRRVPVFVDCDLELIVRGRGRHSREEVDNGGQEIVGHWGRGVGESDGREDKGSGNNSGEGDFEGWASRPEGDLRHFPETPGAPTVPKEKIHTVSQKIHRVRAIKRQGLAWIFCKTIHHVPPAFHGLGRSAGRF